MPSQFGSVYAQSEFGDYIEYQEACSELEIQLVVDASPYPYSSLIIDNTNDTAT